MVHMTEMSLLFVLFMASSAFGQVNKPGSGQTNETQNRVATKQFDSQCPCSWVGLNGRCFIYFSQSLDWASAETHCMNMGAHLISLHSDNEYQLMKSLILPGSPTWLGLNNCMKRDSYFWSDGSKYDYSKWNKDEPNNLPGECCVHVTSIGQMDWNDIPCSRVYPFVCSKKMA
ncbi:type-2 ice-structuring protein-like [Colossoma macropomum]|uniref:type-2 ice-structuring protein-like n=1 Tax=Colossoma macropomum TaxID=42526 RepID=UPI0018651441|nr:type-2 ice-structuring protein-like [Colossoma macropomum]